MNERKAFKGFDGLWHYIDPDGKRSTGYHTKVAAEASQDQEYTLRQWARVLAPQGRNRP